MIKIPTTVLTGFLGAGKTTLLNHILSVRDGQQIGVIVNEFGDIGIDGQLVIGAEEEVLEINNGCICCTVRGDLTRAVSALLERKPNLDHIVIETTGLADPAPVVQSFMLDETLRLRTELDAIVTVVDARHVRAQLDNEQAREQVAFADMVLINKIDLVTGQEVEALVDVVRSLNPLAKIHWSQGCDVDLRHVLGIRAFDLRNVLRLDPQLLADSTHEHDSDIACVSICEDSAIDAARFNRWISDLVQSVGNDLMRTKGIVDISGEARRLVFHGVHMTLDGRPGKPWGRTEPRTSQLVFIGRNLDAQTLRAGFADCRVDAVATDAVATAA